MAPEEALHIKMGVLSESHDPEPHISDQLLKMTCMDSEWLHNTLYKCYVKG